MFLIPLASVSVILPFNPSRTDELSEKIALVLHWHDLRNNMVKRGLVKASQFLWETTAAKTLEVFKRALALMPVVRENGR